MPARQTDEQRDARDDEVLSAIRSYRATHDYGPTIVELLDAVGLKSKASLQNALDRLRVAGRVEWEPGRARTLRVTDA